MKHHPDRNQGDDAKKSEEKFQGGQGSLRDAVRPAKACGLRPVRPCRRRPQHGRRPPGGPGAEGFGGFAEAFGDIFGDIFGGAGGPAAAAARRGGQQVYRGNDLSYAMEITLEEAAAGKDTQIRIPSWDTCDTCSGTGAKPGTSAKVCSTCNGAGAVHMRQGFFSIQQTCPHCHGSGKVIPEPCPPAAARARSRRPRRSRSRFPPGIGEGMRIRSSGNGEPGTNGGPPGDLYIEIRVKQHEIFERDGDDLHCTVPVGLTTAALGGSIDVPTLGGTAQIELPEGTQHGKTFRLRGKGVKGVRSSYPGDLYCHISVETPVKLTERQRELLNELDESFRSSGDRHSPNAKSWTDRVKDLFK